MEPIKNGVELCFIADILGRKEFPFIPTNPNVQYIEDSLCSHAVSFKLAKTDFENYIPFQIRVYRVYEECWLQTSRRSS